MTSSDLGSSPVTWAPPPWFYGSNPARFFANAGLRAAKDGENYSIRSEEGYLDRPSRLVVLESIASPSGREYFDKLQGLSSTGIGVSFSSTAWEHFQNFRTRAESSGQLVDLASFIRSALGLCAPEQVVELARWSLCQLRSVPAESTERTSVFPEAGLFAIARSDRVALRLMPARIELRLQQDKSFNARRSNLGGDQLLFRSSSHLLDGTILLQTYLGPLMGALTPAVWSLSTSRTFGPLVFTLGRAISGITGECAELLQMISLQGSTASTPVPHVSAKGSYQALRWWTERLDDLLGTLTDPANFRTAAGEFDIVRQVRTLATIEQIFSRVTSMQSAYRDRDARETLLFTVFDSMESITGHDFDLLCSFEFASRCFEEVESEIPDSAAEVLLPGARRGLESLRAVQNGFFLVRPDASRIELYLQNGTTKWYSKEAAAAAYLKLRRNATHGHGSNKRHLAEVADGLLAHHDGNLDHDLGLLAYLYLLWLLARPDIVRRRVRRTLTPRQR